MTSTNRVTPEELLAVPPLFWRSPPARAGCGSGGAVWIEDAMRVPRHVSCINGLDRMLADFWIRGLDEFEDFLAFLLHDWRNRRGYTVVVKKFEPHFALDAGGGSSAPFRAPLLSPTIYVLPPLPPDLVIQHHPDGKHSTVWLVTHGCVGRISFGFQLPRQEAKKMMEIFTVGRPVDEVKLRISQGLYYGVSLYGMEDSIDNTWDNMNSIKTLDKEFLIKLDNILKNSKSFLHLIDWLRSWLLYGLHRPILLDKFDEIIDKFMNYPNSYSKNVNYIFYKIEPHYEIVQTPNVLRMYGLMTRSHTGAMDEREARFCAYLHDRYGPNYMCLHMPYNWIEVNWISKVFSKLILALDVLCGVVGLLRWPPLLRGSPGCEDVVPVLYGRNEFVMPLYHRQTLASYVPRRHLLVAKRNGDVSICATGLPCARQRVPWSVIERVTSGIRKSDRRLCAASFIDIYSTKLSILSSYIYFVKESELLDVLNALAHLISA